jgi:predicted MFS family arabinose efflux permease
MLSILGGYYATVTSQRHFTMYLACQLVDKIIHAPFNPFLPIFVAEQLGRPQAFAALLRGAETLAQTAASLGFGLLSTNARAKAALVVASLNTPLAGALFLMRSPGMLIVASALHGALSGVGSSVSSLYLVTLAPPERMGSASSLQYVGNTMGSAIGAAIGGAILARSTGFRTLALTMLVGALPVQIVTALVMPSLVAADPGSKPSGQNVQAASVPATPLASESLRELLGRPAVRALLMMQYLRTCFWGCASMSIPYLLNNLAEHAKSTVGFYSLGSLSSAMVSMLVLGGVSDANKNGGTIARCCLLGLAVLSPCIGVAGRAKSAVGVLVAGWCATCLAWSVSGQINPLTRQVARRGSEGRLTGLVSAAWAAGSLCGAQLHGWGVNSRLRLLYLGLGALLVVAERCTAVLLRAVAAENAVAALTQSTI